MKLAGSPEDIYQAVATPDTGAALARARVSVPYGKQEVFQYQAACLFALARPYDREGARLLEIGTYYGFSAAVLAQAAPQATIVTLNPTAWEVTSARVSLAGFPNVSVMEVRSWDYLAMIDGEHRYDLVFVDGDHKRVRRDLPWWNRLTDGGLFVFHDYSPSGSGRACPPVYRALNDFRAWLGRDFDVLVVDDREVGLAGWYRRGDDPDWDAEV